MIPAAASARVPFASATGKGLKIAVLDSGVNLRHPHITARTQRVLLAPQESLRADDVLGHGTAVMAAIQQKAPDADYYALKLFGATLRTSTDRLLDALHWAVKNRMDIVNLSLGVSNEE